MLNFLKESKIGFSSVGSAFFRSLVLSLLSVLFFQHSIPTDHMGTFTVLLGLLPTPPPTSSQRKRNTNSICVAYTFTRAWSNSQWSATQRNMNFSSAAPLPAAINCGELHLSTVITIFKFLMTSCLSYFSPHNHKSSFPALQSAGAQIMDLHTVSSNNTDHR